MGGGSTELHIEAHGAQACVFSGEETELDVQLKIITEQLLSTRPPLNLCLVLDRSGSMRSQGRLENAKLAIKAVIRALGVQDKIHMVAYGSKVEEIFSNGNVANAEHLCGMVDRVQTEGMTNLSGGYLRGVELVQQNREDGTQNRIFLFSDGLANEGISDKDKLLDLVAETYNETQIKLSAFGLGAQFDEDLMKGLAECGAGAFFFVEGADRMSHFVQHALDGVLSAVASDARLVVSNGESGEVTKIYGHNVGEAALLGDLRDSNVRTVMARIRVKPGEAGCSAEGLRYCLEYTPAEQQGTTEKIEGSLQLHYVGKDDDLMINEVVEVAAAIARAAEYDSEIVSMMDKRDAAGAAEKQKEQVEMLRAFADTDEMCGVLYRHALDAQESLDREGVSPMNRKKFAHQSYMKRRGSVGYVVNAYKK